MTIIGIDPSMTCTGLAAITADGVYTHRVRSAAPKGGTTPNLTADRIALMVRQIRDWIFSHGEIELAVIESPSFGSKGGAAHERGGIWWGTAGHLSEARVPIATAAPTTLKVYATDNGGASKPEVTAAVRASYGALTDIPDNNVADAMTLAAMGARRLGRPIDVGLVGMGIRAMGSAKWPA